MDEAPVVGGRFWVGVGHAVLLAIPLYSAVIGAVWWLW